MVKLPYYVCEDDQSSDSQIKKDSEIMEEVQANATSEDIPSRHNKPKNAYLIQLFRKVIASYIFIFFKYHLRLKITFA